MDGKRIAVFGASGFLGRNVVRNLAKRGALVTAACRDTEAAKFLKPMGSVGQITPVKADVTNAAAVARALAGADAVINLVGILYPAGRNNFIAVHATAPGLIGRAAREAGIERYVQVSAIGADAGSLAAYARTKADGEAAARGACPDCTIIRPSIMFGPNDTFFNRFATLAMLSPVLPLIGGGKTRFQPVYVADVADALIAALDDPATAGQTYELGGPKTYSFRDLMELMFTHTKRPRRLIEVSWGLAAAKAFFLELLPKPLLTQDQVALLKQDNLVADGALTLADLGITPTALEVILPNYLDRFRPGGRYNRSRVAA